MERIGGLNEVVLAGEVSDRARPTPREVGSMTTPRKLCGWAIGAWAAGLALVVPESALGDTPPTQPGAVTVAGVTGLSAELSWGNSTDDVRVVATACTAGRPPRPTPR